MDRAAGKNCIVIEHDAFIMAASFCHPFMKHSTIGQRIPRRLVVLLCAEGFAFLYTSGTPTCLCFTLRRPEAQRVLLVARFYKLLNHLVYSFVTDSSLRDFEMLSIFYRELY